MARNKRVFRVIEYLLTFLVIITLNFSLPRMMPGDPFLHNSGDSNEVVSFYSQEQILYFREYYGLDRPIYQQYTSYLQELARGDLGDSYYYKEAVSSIILRRLPWTLFLVISSLTLSVFLGIILGTYSAWRRNRWQDKLLYLTLIIVSEIPAFLVGLALVILLGAKLKLFPLAGAVTHFAHYDSWWEKMVDILHHAALPILTLTFSRTGSIYLLVRNSLGNILTKDYIRTAKAKGLKEYRIRYIHALRNALMPLFTRIAIQLGALIGGAILAENVFSYPGIGVLLRDAVQVRDYPLIQGLFLVLAVGVMAANMLADLAYKWIDPRTRSVDSISQGKLGIRSFDT